MRNPKALARAKRTLGENMRRLRLAQQMTQKDAAVRAALHWRHFQKIEVGTVNVCLSSLVGIAAALDTTIPELFAPPSR
jgi:transcriptional regulator with XRE-family HTH domain